MGLASIRLITFDCYGTLIDWESGMLAALRPLFSHDGRSVSDQQLLEQYGEIEAEVESGPYLAYRQVLSRTVQEMGRLMGMTISAKQGAEFAETLVQWKPFADTVRALRIMKNKFQLGIISNIDDDLFAETRKTLEMEFDFVVTAQQVRRYKPSLKNFEEALRRSGLRREQILHAAQSRYHDIMPANALGIPNVGGPSFGPAWIWRSEAGCGHAHISRRKPEGVGPSRNLS